MNAYLVIFLSGLGALFFQALHRAYFYLPAAELKRRASRDNRGKSQMYQNIFMVSSYGHVAGLFLGFLTFIFSAACVIAIARYFDPLVALIWLGLFAGLLVLTDSKNIDSITKLAAKMAPYLAKLLSYLEPLSEFAGNIAPGKKSPKKSRLYEKDDLKELLQRQKKAANNRIDDAAIDSAIHALDFADKKIKDHMVKREDVRFVNTKEPIGPILISELHKTGFSCFPVQGNSENEVVGMLHVEDLVRHTSGGVVTDAMNSKVSYVHQDEPLTQVLQSFEKTGLRVCVVVDDEASITGLISVNDVLRNLIGQQLQTDFMGFDNAEAVAKKQDPSSEEES